MSSCTCIDLFLLYCASSCYAAHLSLLFLLFLLLFGYLFVTAPQTPIFRFILCVKPVAWLLLRMGLCHICMTIFRFFMYKSPFLPQTWLQMHLIISPHNIDFVVT